MFGVQLHCRGSRVHSLLLVFAALHFSCDSAPDDSTKGAKLEAFLHSTRLSVFGVPMNASKITNSGFYVFHGERSSQGPGCRHRSHVLDRGQNVMWSVQKRYQLFYVLFIL
ncbi:hypothetical protein EDB84DRAFT_1000405 [Lactarius hengduanensis]|nr:hypothetical protein EDB84DRAFT_1000405 [Lactarius hengduanensis]